jgi:hypothetical protein
VSVLGDIARTAAERKLSFLVAGGHAVIAHGFSRATFDIDLAVRRADKDGWMKLASDLGYEFYFEGPTFLQFKPPSSTTLALDLMMFNEETFGKFVAEAVAGPASEPHTRVLALEHLLALKCHAIKYGHKGRIVKDADDVIRLVQINRIDINDPGIRDLFVKYGTADLYEKVRRICCED